MRRVLTTICVLLTTLAGAAAAMTQQVTSAPFDYGVIVSLPGQDYEAMSDSLRQLGVGWVKHEIPWRDFELSPGQINLALLDEIVSTLEAGNYQIMFTITTAPDWSRTIREENGPPDDLSQFGAFVGQLAERYKGRVHAYEVWSEPNLRSRWKSAVHPIGAESYMALLQAAHSAIKNADPTAVVVSAGLAPTGYNDAFDTEAGGFEVNAVDDRVFLESLYAAGLASYTDAVGVNAMGWANPPDARCCEPLSGVQSHYEDPRFYFIETLEAYRGVMERAEDTGKALWVTAFGWGTSEDLGEPDPLNTFMSYTDLDEQARYIRRAFEIGYWLDYVGPMFLSNLNGCLAPANFDFDACYYSLIGPNGAPRPAYNAVAALDKRLRSTTPTPHDEQAGSSSEQPNDTRGKAGS